LRELLLNNQLPLNDLEEIEMWNEMGTKIFSEMETEILKMPKEFEHMQE